MHDYREISRLMEKTMHKYMQIEKMSRDYSGIILSQAEVHMVACIGDYPSINVTKLAAMRGVTKGAASQMIYKLVDKKLVLKSVSPDSDTEVCLNLTELGLKVHKAHQEYHDHVGDQFFNMLRDMPKGYEEYATKLMIACNVELDKKLLNKK